jgi:(E)-4-hydroxy-3-methylbut-2-enyl-diphosphate synthase
MVNGPGEAREADIGLAFGPNGAVIFKKGDVFRRLKGKGIISEFIEEAKKFEKK